MKKEMVGGELVAALQKRGKVGEELEVALLKREMEVPLGEAQRLVEKVASQAGACQEVARLSAGQEASLGGAMTAAIQEGALWVKVAASENMGQKEVALTCSPYTGSSRSEMN